MKTIIATGLKWSSLERASKNMKLCNIEKVFRMNSFQDIDQTKLDPCTFSCKSVRFFPYCEKTIRDICLKTTESKWKWVTGFQISKSNLPIFGSI